MQCLACFAAGRHVAAGTEDGYVSLLTVPGGELVRRFRAHTDDVYGLAISADGWLATCGDHRTVRLFDPVTGERLAKLRGGEDELNELDIAAGGGLIAAGGDEGEVCLWRPDRRDPLFKAEPHDGRVTAVAFAPTGDALVTGDDDGLVMVWNLPDLSLRGALDVHGSHVKAIAFSADGEVFVTAGNSRTLRAWDLDTGERLSKLRGHDDEAASGRSPS